MKFLITGGSGFIGSNLAAEVLLRNHELTVFDNLSRSGSNENLLWLKERGQFRYLPSDIRNYNDVETAILEVRPDVVFHLAGQVAMTTSIANPRLDFETNALGTHNLLEAVRKHCPNSMVLYSSTNKVYGDFEDLNFLETETRYVCENFPHGLVESFPLSFHSPYGCSKGAADQYLLDYSRIFGLRTVVFRHSSMYGGNQHATYDQGWVGWFCQQALAIKKGMTNSIQISGSGKQVRDVLHSDDVVSLYFQAVDSIENIAGQVFNVGGGMDNSLSLLELFQMLEDKLRIKIQVEKLPWRASDQRVFIADNSKVSEAIKWHPAVSKEIGIDRVLAALETRKT